MIFSRILLVYLLLIPVASYAFEKCALTTTTCVNTKLGKLEYIWGSDSSDRLSHILLNDIDIFTNDSYQIGEDVNGNSIDIDADNKLEKLIIYYLLNSPQHISGDLYRYYFYRVLDFSGKKVIISNEFYPPADYDAKLEWISWGKKNSVIAFEDGSRFKYENGHVTMIDEGSAKASH